MTIKKEANTEKTLPKCGLIAPIAAMDGCSEGHWEEVRLIIKEALQGTDFIVELVSDSNEIGIIQKRIVENIYYNEMVICDVSGKNPNVMFELGMRLAFDKPTIIIKDDKTNYSFDTAPIEHIEYPRDLHYQSIQNFKTKLKSKVIATYEASKKTDYTTFLKHFGQFVTTGIESKPVGAEQFIVEALIEMKSELRSLKSARNSNITPSGKFILAGDSAISEKSVRSFVEQYLAQNQLERYNISRTEMAPLTDHLTGEFLSTYKIPTSAMAETRILVSGLIWNELAKAPF